MINSLCILGGGTSGLVAALMLRKAYPELKITMIESSKYGIVGVGEGSTEHWKKFMTHIGVDASTLIRETGATFKVGIKFTNWQGDGKHYFHSLAETYGAHSPENGLPYMWLKMVGDNCDPLDTVYSGSVESVHSEPLHDILAQYHFDTFKLNTFLHKLCSERNIAVEDTEINDVVLDDHGYVSHLIDVTGKKHYYEFYFDCSGFRRVIASKLGAKWVDCTQELMMNSAIAFPTGYTEDIPSYTESTALSSGWVWRIPTQDRYGNGYVYCDNFINDDDAYTEVQNHYKNNLNINEELKIGRKVKFGAGYVDKFWIKNCVSIGLSGIFVEPLEASSIGTTIQQCFLLLPAMFYYERGDVLTTKHYNMDMEYISKNIIDFIQLHYFVKRDDTPFWKWCKNEMKITDFNKEYLDYFKKYTPHPHCFTNPMGLFSHLNFSQVMHGLGLCDSENIKRNYEMQLKKYDDIVKIRLYENVVYRRDSEHFTHREALSRLKERYSDVKYKF